MIMALLVKLKWHLGGKKIISNIRDKGQVLLLALQIKRAIAFFSLKYFRVILMRNAVLK